MFVSAATNDEPFASWHFAAARTAFPQPNGQDQVPAQVLPFAWRKIAGNAAQVHNQTEGWLAKEFAKIGRLEPNWDGYGAEPIPSDVQRRMLSILIDRLPLDSVKGTIVPGADGSLQAEWHLRELSLTFTIEPEQAVFCCLEIGGSEKCEAGTEALELLRNVADTVFSRAHRA